MARNQIDDKGCKPDADKENEDVDPLAAQQVADAGGEDEDEDDDDDFDPLAGDGLDDDEEEGLSKGIADDNVGVFTMEELIDAFSGVVEQSISKSVDPLVEQLKSVRARQFKLEKSIVENTGLNELVDQVAVLSKAVEGILPGIELVKGIREDIDARFRSNAAPGGSKPGDGADVVVISKAEPELSGNIETGSVTLTKGGLKPDERVEAGKVILKGIELAGSLRRTIVPQSDIDAQRAGLLTPERLTVLKKAVTEAEAEVSLH